ncbi:hypothetical protein ACSS6W_005894 [Trichoderma asperelloides]
MYNITKQSDSMFHIESKKWPFLYRYDAHVVLKRSFFVLIIDIQLHPYMKALNNRLKAYVF